MSAPTKTIGTQIDGEPLVSSQCLHKLVTLQDLLAELQQDKQFAMLRTTAGHIANFLDVPVERVTIDALVGIVPELRSHLKQRRYARNAVNSYCNNAGVLFRRARELGWVPSNPEIPEEWEVIMSANKHLKGASGIIKFAIARGKTPATFTDDDMENWARMMLNQGRCYEYLRALPHKFRKVLLTAGLTEKVPGLFRNWKTVPPYFVPLRNFPPGLRQEVAELLRWKQAEYVPTRRKKRLRAVSARNLENVITRLYGFAVNVRPGLDQAPIAPDPSTIRTLTDLATFDNISAFTGWWLNVRKRTERAIVVMWGALCAALKEHPNYKGKDFTWFDDLMRGIPYEPESKRRERKERKYLPYETVADIPRRIRERRKEASKLSTAHVARMVHDELLMTWITVLPWRQKEPS